MLATVRIVTFSKHENLKILKGQPEAVNRRRTDNTMAKKGEKTNTDLQNTTQKTKDRAKQTQCKTGMNSGASEG